MKQCNAVGKTGAMRNATEEKSARLRKANGRGESEKSLSAQQRFVAGKGFAGNLFKFMHQIFHGQFLFFIAADIENDTAVVHHDQAVAVGDSVTHIMGDHQCG